MEQNTPRKVALIASCLLTQNAKVCQGAHYAARVSPVVEALRSRGYLLQQLPCPELAFAGVRRWWAVYEQYDTPAYRTHCRRLAQADRKSTRLNSSHSQISYAVFCLKKKKLPEQPSALRRTRPEAARRA